MQQQTVLRPYERTYARRVVEIINMAAAQTLGIQRAVVDAMGNVRLTRYVPPTSQKVVAVNAQEEVIGYAYLATSEPYVVNEMGGAVHPHYWGQGVGRQLLAWAEQKAGAMADRAPMGVKTLLQANLFEAEAAAIQLFSQCGFRKMREWAHLLINLAEPPPLPTIPGGMLLRPIDLSADWDLVGPAMDDAFADHWGAIPPTLLPAARDEDQALEQSLDPAELQDDSYSNLPGFCFVLIDGTCVAGGILCNAKLVERQESGRVGSLFVRPAYRRQGVGRALMPAAFNVFWRRGVYQVITDTDADSFTQAPKFYASLGLLLYRRELLYEKEIRSGREVRRLDP